MRALVALLALLPVPAFAQTLDLTGYVAARATNATGPASWLEGRFGRLEASGDGDDFAGAAQLGVDWRPSRYLQIHASGAARRDPEEFGGRDIGLIEAYADGRIELGLDEVRLRAGFFFLPTSRENVDPLWASPYTINFSALNTWIGQEVRPLGADLQWRHTLGNGHSLTTAATAFRGNDTMATLLAWRGWSVGNRLSTYDEVLPLPPLESLQTSFFLQRDDGTKPFGIDLDGDGGYSARVRYSVPGRGNIQYAWLDNKGDRLVYRGEYAWATTFHLLGAEIGDPDRFIVAAEYLRGTTAMGETIFPSWVEADFDAAYLLVSDKIGRSRWSARLDVFSVTDIDLTPAENNDESGTSWTLAWMYDLYANLRLAAEFTQVTGDKLEAERSGFDRSTDGHTFMVELRYGF